MQTKTSSQLFISILKCMHKKNWLYMLEIKTTEKIKICWGRKGACDINIHLQRRKIKEEENITLEPQQ